jgi:hypothetical protein
MGRDVSCVIQIDASTKEPPPAWGGGVLVMSPKRMHRHIVTAGAGPPEIWTGGLPWRFGPGQRRDSRIESGDFIFTKSAQ